MFVLLAIPIAGGFIAGRFVRSPRIAMIITGLLWLGASVWMIINRAVDQWNDFNINFWIGIAVGLFGFVSARLGYRVRSGRAQASLKRAD